MCQKREYIVSHSHAFYVKRNILFLILVFFFVVEKKGYIIFETRSAVIIQFLTLIFLIFEVYFIL